MPKRVLDFDAVWASDKLASCAPWARAEYTWIYGLADSNGSFELTNLRVIFGRVYAIREDISIRQLARVLDEFHGKGLLFLWEENGKKYGHWTGSDVPGRLPAPSWRARLERLAPPVPRAALASYMSAFSSSKLKASPGTAQAQDLDLDLGLDLEREEEAAAARSSANPIHNSEIQTTAAEIATPETATGEAAIPETVTPRVASVPVNSPGAAAGFHHARLRISAQLDAKLALEFPELPEAARRVEYERMAVKLEEAGESARHAGNYARAWLRGVGGCGSPARVHPVQRELWTGRGPEPAAFGISVKPAALERIRAREEARANANRGLRAMPTAHREEKAS